MGDAAADPGLAGSAMGDQAGYPEVAGPMGGQASVSMEWTLDSWDRIWNPWGQAPSHGAEQS